MEAGGLAVGICFEYVQLGRSFGTNFQSSLLKLDNVRLRLLRWGQAVGLSGELEDARSLQEATVQKEDISKAERILGQILELFADAEGISAKYKRSVQLDDASLAVLDVHADMDAVGQSLHDKMRKLCIQRQNRTTLRQKVKWALYEEKHFERLIEDIIDLVNALLEVFPAVKQEQLKLYEFEVLEIMLETLSALIDIVRAQEKDFEAAISAAMRSDQNKRSTTFNNYNSKIANQVASMAIHGG
ncbi:hypothetical protein CC86DRAFT_396644 [Ophiobolus disseminans]|uniref:Prion-inhibition and propagation HeLo domain-containing protein n=1 Tax=Ophiobolus disseminans TaxID=1469910 RepID=A0A6A6ZMP6_9PLEO|nr:hypothetical protein CC86DRAFT_396644 [Ophiobolus disseminans]